MKKLFSFLMVFAMAMSLLTGCGLSGGNATSTLDKPDSAALDTLPENPTLEQINAFVTAPSSNPDKVVIKYTNQASDMTNQSYQRGNLMFLKALKEELGDKVQIEIYLNGTLGNSTEAIIGGLQSGTFQMTDYSLGSYASYTNAFQPLDIPYLVKNADDAFALLNGEAGEIMGAKLEADTGIMPIFYNLIGMRQLTNSKHVVDSPDDLANLKLRTQSNSVQMTGMSAFGCAITNIAFTELFTSLQQGVVDAQENPLETIYAYQYYDVQDYLTVTNHLCGASAVLCNRAWYDSLSDEFKAAIDKASAYAVQYSQEDFNASESAVLDELKAVMTVTELTDDQVAEFQAVAKTKWPELAKEIGEDYVNEVLTAADLSIE